MSTSSVIDLRSDTVTRPTSAMREAMARAEVGDDVYGEDPTVRALEERVAALAGKESALFVPSGTMANQLALLVHCRPGDDVVVGDGAHSLLYESGAGAALAGVQFSVAGSGGLYTEGELAERVHPSAYWYPRSRLAIVENTHNRGGGRVWPLAQLEAVCAAARRHGLATHLDGARAWNAHVASGAPLSAIAAPFDTASFCLSKGLGAPVGSLFLGPRELVGQAHRLRKMLGGGMRQAGVLAAAGLYALEHHVTRLEDDHANARRFAAHLAGVPRVTVAPPETNIVVFDLDPQAPVAADAAIARAKTAGVLISAMGPRRLRAVTHLDVSATDCERAGALVAELLRRG